MRKVFNSIDIGTDSIKLITVEYFDNKFNVLCATCLNTNGLKQGLIVDSNAVVATIKKCVKISENKLGTKISQVLAIVPSHNIMFDMVNGTTSINSLEKKVTGDVIFDCLGNAIKPKVSSSTEVVMMNPIEYKIDSKDKIKNPLGLVGNELSLKAIVASVPKKNVYSVVNLIESIGIEVVDICFSSVANYYSIKAPEIDSKVVTMIDIGCEKTSVSIFNKGVMIKEVILPYGSLTIDDEISFAYKTTLEESKKIKETFAVANRKYADNDESYTCINRLGEKITINQYHLAELIEAKVVEMLKNIKNEINSLTKREISYIMITGGMTSMLGFNAIVDELFVESATVINIGIVGIRENKYTSCYGLVRYFIDKLKLREKEYTMYMDDKIEEMLSTRKKIGAAGVLGKIFDKIFD